MMHRLHNLRAALDLRLLLGGVLGFLVFFLALPYVHPDAGVTDHLSEDELRARADAEVGRLGVDASQLNVLTNLRRHNGLLEAIQEGDRLPRVVDNLKRDSYVPLPVYYYRIRYERPSAGAEEPDRVAEVRLLPDGRLVHLETPGVTQRARDPEALRSVGLDPDTALTRRYLIISGSDPLDDTEAIEGTRVEPEQLARFHLERTAWAEMNFTRDSVRVVQTEEEDAVSVIFRADTLIAGMQPRVRVDVGIGGGLREVALESFQAEEQVEAEAANVTFGSDGREGPLAIMTIVAHVLLFLVLLALFFRRLDARLVDARGALRDGLWGAFWGLISSGLIVGYSVVGSTGPGALPIFLALLISLSAAAATFLVVFLASAVGDSYAREAWPDQVRALDLVRRLSPLNRTVGGSIVHGTAVAGLILAVCTAALWLPGSRLALSGALPAEESWRPLLSSPAGAAWFSMYAVLGTAAAVGGFLRRRSRVLAFIVPVLVFGVIEIAPLTVNPVAVAVLLSLVTGAAVMALFARHGTVAAIVALVVATVLFDLAPGWLAAPIPETFDAVGVIVLFAGLLVLGLVGAASDDDLGDGAVYVPAYVTEHSEQQRMERELEIARDVQMSFLPRVMPKVPGVDTAALCIPANEVGGDYYDVILLDDHRLAVVIGDVSGKGIQAAFYMTLVKGIIQTLVSDETPPREVLSHVNRIFYRNAPRGMFISLIYGVYDVSTGRFVYARAGHNPILISRRTGTSFECPPGIAVGLAPAASFDSAIQEQVVDLMPGESVILYTDGVSEAMNASREQFGEERIADVVAASGETSAGALLTALHRAIEGFAVQEGLLDDMTLIVLRRAEAAEQPVDGLSTSQILHNV